MADPTTRVVLLARPGEACTRLDAALREAGAEIALVADPTTVDPEDVIAAQPQAILVALEPMVEDALERYDALLSDPAIIVIFDEAELAAQREGWDAARWTRHLAAKLNRHDDVLPPGWEAEADWQPVPGPLPPPRAEPGELDITAFAGEALERAAEVPRHDGFDLVFAADDDTDMDLPSPSGGRWREAPDEGAPFDDGNDGHASPQNTATDRDEATDIVAVEDMDWSSSADFSDTPLVDDDFAALLEEDGGDAGDGTRDAPVIASTLGDSLSLADDDAPFVSTAPTTGQEAERDREELDRRLEGLSLADADSYGHGPLRGAVLVEAGLGGPDAVRQLLADIPKSFPRPILVRLQLDGGRYDRLVKQMARASKLPVTLAVAEQPAEAGTIYFLPPTMTVLRDRARLVFAEADIAHAAHSLYAELPPNDSAMLFLSGSSPALVDIAMAHIADGALVAGQTPETCYDGAAASALIARGGSASSPAELAERLAERWSS